MNENHIKKSTVPQPLISGLGFWPLWNLGIVCTGGLLLLLLLHKWLPDTSIFIGIAIAGSIGGLIGGFLPLLDQKLLNHSHSLNLSWVCIVFSVILIFLPEFFNVAFIHSSLSSQFYFLYILDIPGFIISFLVTWMTRPVCNRILKSDGKWWMWIFLTIEVFMVPFILVYLELFVISSLVPY
jgi:hypothetical protein